MENCKEHLENMCASTLVYLFSLLYRVIYFITYSNTITLAKLLIYSIVQGVT